MFHSKSMSIFNAIKMIELSFLLIFIYNLRGSREDMVAAASGMVGSKGAPSDGDKSGLTGSIYGQDVEAAKLPSKGNI